jgi:hypothetical protein
MQCRFNHSRLTAWLLLLAFPVLLQAGDVKLIRTIEKAFTSSSNQLVDLRNQYGDIYINSTSGSRITMKVTIVGRGRTEEVAQKLIDEVLIKTSNSGSSLKISTETPRSPGLKLGDKGLSVKYELGVPRSNPLKVINKFGNIHLGDRKGNLELFIKNGKLIAGRLEGRNNALDGHFSHAEIDYLRYGQIDFNFGGITIGETDYLKVDVAGGDVAIGIAGTLEMYVKQGKASIGRAETVSGTYSSRYFALGYLGKKLDMDVKYAESFTIGEVGADFTSIDIEQSYTPIKINFNQNAKFTLEAKLQRGRLNYDAPTVSMTIMEIPTEQCDCNQMNYFGQFGEGADRGGVVEIEGYYGSVKIMQ